MNRSRLCFSSRFFWGLAVAAFCAVPVGSQAADPLATTTVFTGATIIDGTGRPPLQNATLLILGDRIKAIGDGSTPLPIPTGARTVDLHGKTIIPGLISAHSHLGLTNGASTASAENYTRENVARQLAQYERYGVTAVMSLGVNRDVLYDWRDEQRQGKLGGADIFTADRGIGVAGGAPPFPLPGDQVYRPANAAEARDAVREMAGRHPDLIKLWLDDMFGTLPKMQPEVYQAAVAEAHAAITEAHAHGLSVAAHIFYLGDAKALVAAGVDIIAHSVRDLPVDEAFAASLKAKNVAYIPTLSLDESQFVYADHPGWMDTPFFTAAVDPALIRTWLSPAYADKIRGGASTPKNQAAFAMAMKNVKTLHAAGVFIAMGTDSGAMPTRVAGFAEHRELQLLVEAGLSPMDALVAATVHSAKVIGQENERGTLTPGKRADFLVLDANPLDDIRNTTRLSAVWHGGKRVSTGPIPTGGERLP